MQSDEGGVWQAWRRFAERWEHHAAPPDDPEILLEQAQEAMRQAHRKHREFAVQAITQKNNLQQMLLDTRRKVEILTEQANAAELRGEEAQAYLLRRDVSAYHEAAEITERQLEEAEETVAQVKRAIQSEEETLWCKTAEGLSLRVQWKAVQIERELARCEMERSAGQELQIGEVERYLHHRRLLVEAVIGKDQLAQMTRDMNHQIEVMGTKAEHADKRGRERLANHFLRAREQHEATLMRVAAISQRADEVVERARELLDAEYQSLTERAVAIPDETEAPTPPAQNVENLRRGRVARRIAVMAAIAACLILLLIVLAHW